MKTIAGIACLIGLIASPLHAADHNLAFKPITGGFFALSVANMPESVAWYSQKLGLSVVFEVRGSLDVTTLEGGGLLVELVRNPAARPRTEAQPDLVQGPFKAGFMVKDLDKTLDALRARGVQIAFGPFPAQGGQRANAIILDNSGNLIQIFGD